MVLRKNVSNVYIAGEKMKLTYAWHMVPHGFIARKEIVLQKFANRGRSNLIIFTEWRVTKVPL